MEKWKQGSGLLAAIFFSLLMAAAAAENRGEWNVPGGHDWSQFLLKKSEVVTKTEAGEIRVFRGHTWNGHPPRLHIGFVTLEPSSQLIPVYLDADLILFVRRGEVKIGWIHEDELVERQLKAGAVLRIPAGSIFYYVNNNEHQLQIIAGIEPVGTDLIDDLFTPFYVGGGELPPSALAGFDLSTLTTAFNATPEEVRALTAARFGGSIINIISEDDDNHLQRFAGAMNSAMGKLKQGRKLTQNDEVKTKESTKEACTWSSIFSSFFFGETATENNKIQLRGDDPVEAPDAYNIYDHDPNFKNDYGYTVEVNEHDYSPLKHSDISVYLVNISAGSILAPHVNPRATEYGIVIAGSGTVEIVNPNGTKALKAEVTVGDVFWVPRFYPFAYVAGREGPLVILGFTTSSRKNRAQFLAGKGSTLSLLIGKELAAGFGVTEEELKQLVHKQVESVILPSWE
ncbi:vicilin-like seed storage protein At2g28490 [Phalaenopsis equestris]|uniref:vicilin-like seed storage protein At2g28490 n=1 Tax=Phalaenopsis equestris TaxID=78828 RepID=UPI0009E2C6B6|nr:vicilin-like seed storage protein At2g28490 [Phalaenopsis equestris]